MERIPAIAHEAIHAQAGPAFERPSCPSCDQDMWLIRAEPHAVLTAYDVWSFECPDCKATKELTVDRLSKTPPP